MVFQEACDPLEVTIADDSSKIRIFLKGKKEATAGIRKTRNEGFSRYPILLNSRSIKFSEESRAFVILPYACARAVRMIPPKNPINSTPPTKPRITHLKRLSPEHTHGKNTISFSCPMHPRRAGRIKAGLLPRQTRCQPFNPPLFCYKEVTEGTEATILAMAVRENNLCTLPVFLAALLLMPKRNEYTEKMSEICPPDDLPGTCEHVPS